MTPSDDQSAGERSPAENPSRLEIEDILSRARAEQGSWKRLTSSVVPAGVQHHRRRWSWLPWVKPKAPTSLEEVILADHHLDVQLKSVVARGALGAMFAQLLVADVVFVFYAAIGLDWNVPSGVMLGWLSATVVEVIGVVIVVAGYLFPKDGHRWSRPSAPQFRSAPAAEVEEPEPRDV